MKKALLLAGVLLDLTGVVWILQGFNVLPGSFMTGQMIWAYIGIAVSMIGSVVIWIAVRGGAGSNGARCLASRASLQVRMFDR